MTTQEDQAPSRFNPEPLALISLLCRGGCRRGRQTAKLSLVLYYHFSYYHYTIIISYHYHQNYVIGAGMIDDDDYKAAGGGKKLQTKIFKLRIL